MKYRELQLVLKRLRQEGKIDQRFKLNQKRELLLAEFNRAVADGLVEPPESPEDKVIALEAQVAQLQKELLAYKTRESAKSELDVLLMDFVYRRGVGDNEIFESPEALEGKPEGEGRDDWSFFHSTLKGRYYSLSKRYHPDNGGTEEQMRNLTRSYESALTYVKANNGMEL